MRNGPNSLLNAVQKENKIYNTLTIKKQGIIDKLTKIQGSTEIQLDIEVIPCLKCEIEQSLTKI